MLNLAILVEQGAKRNPDKAAVTYEGYSMTYNELHQKACQTAQAISALRIGLGDNVALMCPNIPEFIVIFFGILKTGATVVPINILLKPDEISFHLADSDSKLFFCYAGNEDLPMGQYAQKAFEKTEGCKKLIMIGALEEDQRSFDQFIKDQPLAYQSVDTSSEDTAVIIYTSGTTGSPKGAELSHINLLTNSDISCEIVNSKEFETQLIVLPLFHIFGLTVMMLAGIRRSLHLILLPKFEAKTVYHLIKTFHINIFGGVPSMYWALLNEEDNEGNRKTIQYLRIAISGGASLPRKILDEFEHRFQVPIIEGYGMSEGSPVVTFNQLKIGRKPGSIGTPIWGIEVKIVDQYDNELPIGEKGELIFRGPNVMKSYYKNIQNSQEVLRNGWMHSGDIAVQDEDGFFFIVERIKELIIRGGENIYPREVEETLMKHPDISLVAVVGIPDEKLGEEVKAFIVKHSNSIVTEEDIIDWARNNMAKYKYPRKVQFISKMPLTASGKIMKKSLKDYN